MGLAALTPHHRPCRGLHHRSIRHPLPNASPAPQRGTPHPLSTASRMATVPPLPPVPHADGTSSGTHSTGQQRHAHSLPRIHKATPATHPSDTALRTHRIETRTRPPGNGPSPTTNPATGPERSQTHADHRHPPRGKMAHTEAPHDRLRPAKGPPRFPEHATHMLGL